jgi:hypothetical protein
VTLTEGRQNQIRRMFKSLGFLVEKLRRVRIASLSLDKLPLGTFRELTPVEIKRLAKPVASAGKTGTAAEAKSGAADGQPRPAGKRVGFAKNKRAAKRKHPVRSIKRSG